MKSAAEVGDYLGRVLALDPRTEAGTLIELRGRFLFGGSAAPASALPRREVQAAVAEFAGSAGELDAESLEMAARIPGIDAFPDLAHWRARVIAAAGLRAAFQAAAADPKVEQSVVDRLWRLACAPVHEVDSLRERFLAEAGNIRLLKKTTRRLRRRHPALAALDPVWFEEVKVMKATRPSPSKVWAMRGWWILVYFVLLRVLRWLFSDD